MKRNVDFYVKKKWIDWFVRWRENNKAGIYFKKQRID